MMGEREFGTKLYYPVVIGRSRTPGPPTAPHCQSG